MINLQQRVFGYEPYEYKKCPTLRIVRLLKLLPPTRSAYSPFRSTLQIELIEYDLDAPAGSLPEYEALSYTWGTRAGQNPSWRIIIQTAEGPRHFLIYRNLYLALHALRDRNATTLPIFVDQICINQHDDPERDCQVQLMGEVYSRCSRVLVWLGPASSGSDTLFDFANRVGGETTVQNLLSTPPQERLEIINAIIGRTCSAEDKLLSIADEHVPRFPFRGYADVLKRPWFTRLWIIQEASLAPKGVFLCGSRSLTFDFFRALYFFHVIASGVWNRTRDTAVSAAEMRLRDDLYQLAAPFVRIFGERMAIIHRGRQRLSLYELVKKYSVNGDDDDKIGATMPEDRIFGLLGLAGPDGPRPETGVGDPKQTYIEFAREVIRTDVDVLCFSQQGKCVEGLPSWVPDWSMPRIRIPYGYTSLTSGPLYNAGGPPSGEAPQVEPDGTLRVRGITVDRVRRVGQAAIKLDEEPLTIIPHDYSSLAGFFGEIDSFLEASASISGPYNHYAAEEGRLQQAKLCLTDGGLTTKQFPDSSNPDNGPPLAVLYEELRRFAARLVRDQETARTYTSFARTFAKHRPQPGFWTRALPPLRLLVLLFAALDAALAVARFGLHMRLQPLRRRLAGVPVPAVADGNTPDPNGVVDMRIHRSAKMFEYKSNIFRNHGRKLYLTDGGLVGLGPGQVREGDVVVVLPGGSVPHVVRHVGGGGGGGEAAARETGAGDGEETASGEERATEAPGDLHCVHVGESYCHGVMDGEAVSAETRYCVVRVS